MTSFFVTWKVTTHVGEHGSVLQDLFFSFGLFFLSQKWLKTTDWSDCFLHTTCWTWPPEQRETWTAAKCGQSLTFTVIKEKLRKKTEQVFAKRAISARAFLGSCERTATVRKRIKCMTWVFRVCISINWCEYSLGLWEFCLQLSAYLNGCLWVWRVGVQLIFWNTFFLVNQSAVTMDYTEQVNISSLVL